MDVPLYKELGAAYNDPYWYRPHNGITTRAQAVQIRNYYSKTELPPYGDCGGSAETQAQPANPEEIHEEGQTGAHVLNAPQHSIIEIDQDMEEGTDTTAQAPVGALTVTLRWTITIAIDEEEWQHDASTMTEEDYILKYYAKATNLGVTMDMCLGLRTRK